MNTVWQKMKACKRDHASKQDLRGWLEDTWSDASDLEHLAYFLMSEIEGMFDHRAPNATVNGDVVVLRFQRSHLDRVNWLAGRVWSEIDDMEDRLMARLNQTEMSPDEVAKPAEKVDGCEGERPHG